jgi:Tol biopolymer transport system component
MAGGAPRPLLRGVYGADWSPDGKDLAVARTDENGKRLEFPIGTVIYPGRTLDPRVSPDGKLVAFLELGVGICVVDRAGKKRVLTDWSVRAPGGLAWSPKGDEVWYAGSEGTASSLYAVTLAGKRRVVARFPSLATLKDISPSGRLLITFGELRSEIIGLPPGETRERDLSWLDLPNVRDISRDGKTVLFNESGEGVRGTPTAYLRSTDGSSPPVRLGEAGLFPAFSPDSRWVVAQRKGAASELLLWPTGAGESKVVSAPGLELESGEIFPDGKRLLLEGRQPGRPARLFVMDLPAGTPRPITPEGISSPNGQAGVSPDGRSVAAMGPNGEILIFGVDGGEPRKPPGPKEFFVGPWSSDGRSLYVAEKQGLVIKFFRRDLVSGRRDLVREIAPSDPAGVFGIVAYLAQDGASYVYTYWRFLGNLFLVDGLK